MLDNELALTHLALGSIDRARDHAALADQRLRRLGDESGRAHVVETTAQIELAAGAPGEAARLASEARTMAKTSDNAKAYISAGLTLARAERALGHPDAAAGALADAADRARSRDRRSQLRSVLTEWADLLAESGDVRRAYELSREALSLTGA